MTKEEVDSPDHYTAGDIECIDAIESMLSVEEFRGMLRGNIIKYLWRAGKKGEPNDVVTDIGKAMNYVVRLNDTYGDPTGKKASADPKNEVLNEVARSWSPWTGQEDNS